MPSVSLARRAALLSPDLPAPAPAHNIAFDSGHAFPGILPDLSREADAALSRHRAETLQYAPRTGLSDLRKWIAEYMAADDARVSPDHILVTNGAKHAIELVCRVLLDEGDTVVVTRPTYFSAIPIIRSFGAQFLEIGQDHDGLDVAELAGHLARLAAEGRALPKFIYNVSDYHNPTGVTMPLERRTALLDVARQYGILIVDDSPYRSVRFEGAPVTPLAALDRDGIVIHLGTFAKLLAPGLRVGWAHAAPALIARMAQLKTDAGSCPLTQRIIVEFCARGRLADHTRLVQATYRDHRDRMVAAVRRELPDASFTIPLGGYYLWLAFPAGVDGDVLARRAFDAGVTIIAGSRFFANADGGHPRHHVRLAFSHAAPDEIDEGVRRLGAVYRALTAMPAAAGVPD